MDSTIKPAIKNWLDNHCAEVLGATPAEVHPLAGDASARAYYRVRLGQGSTVPSALLMEFPPGLSVLGAEEATEGECPITELPFLNVARHLANAGIPVPRIYLAAPEEGLLLLEDLGNAHLHDVISSHDPDEHAQGLQLFGEAIDVMAQMHEKASAPADGDDCTAFYQRMSEGLFIWEFDHFLEYGYDVPVGEALADPERGEVRALFASLSKELAALPGVFTHRDYHSQNILVSHDRIVLIDFQDALMGPSLYDLASLLRDRYFGLSEEEIDVFLHRYLAARPACVEAQMEFAALRRLFDIQVMQRNMKAAGRFVYIDRVKGKSHLLVHLPALFASMQSVIARHEELAVLAPMVERARQANLK